MLTLKFFNAVVEKNSSEVTPFISTDGYVIVPGALWAKDKIIDFYNKEKLSGNDLNQTFHKSWKKIKDSSRCELFIEQITHYISTYGSNFQDEVYIPQEVLDVPDVKLKYKVIKALSKEELINKCLDLLKSGIALKEETIDELLTMLVDNLNYNFTGKEGIKNKEAIVKIADAYHVYPDNPTEFLRYIIYRTTDTTLLIKNKEMIERIQGSSYNPAVAFKEYGLVRLSEIFNRFKPLFLAYKSKCPSTINKIAKLSKKYHKPLVSNALNEVTQRKLVKEDLHWLNNATPFALFKALSTCYTRSNGQDTFVYRIRNGKSWVKEGTFKKDIVDANYKFILKYLKHKYPLDARKVFLPKNVDYALPTSEKLFVGNIPTGTRFRGKKMAVGMYWRNDWGARDLDLSGLNIGGKVGWNASYKQSKGSLMYSGDLTDATNGAVEYLYAKTGLTEPTLVMNNVYSGQDDCEYKIIVGKGDKISRDYMMDPNKLFAEIKCKSVQLQTILGIFIPDGDKQSFVLLNFGAGHARVSGRGEITKIATKALYQQWANAIGFKDILKELGAEIVDKKEDADFDFSLDNLEKDSFVRVIQAKNVPLKPEEKKKYVEK